PGFAVEREYRFRMELDGRYRQAAMLQSHDEPIVGDCRDDQLGGQTLAFDEQRVISASDELPREALEGAAAEHVDAGGLAVHGVVENAELSAEVLADALQAEAHAEQR